MNINNYKILVVGLGSIGKRHTENLEALGIPCDSIFIARTRKGTPSFGDEILNKHGNRHPIFTDLKEALAQKPDIVFITNPTALHVPTALEALKSGCHVFVEKPLSHSNEGTDELLRIAKEKNRIVYIGFNYRFHPLMQEVKKMIEERTLGKIVSIHAENAERISDWHSWEDYRITYGARSDLGGGTLTTQSHEFDYLYWLFGKPKWVFCAGGHLSDLEMDVEDTTKTTLQFSDGAIASIHHDYIQKPPKRFCEIVGTKGIAKCDFIDQKLRVNLFSSEEKIIEPHETFERNVMYQKELADFFNCIEQKKEPSLGIAQGKDVMDIIVAAKESLQTNKVVYLT